MATTIVYVNTASTGGDGTTNNTSGGTAAYSSLSASLSARAGNLTGITCDVRGDDGNMNIAMDILCTGTSADTNIAYITPAWTTDVDHRLRIRLNATGSGAKWDSNLYRLVAGAYSYTGSLNLETAAHVTFQDLQVESTSNLNAGGIGIRLREYAYNARFIRGFYRTTSTTGAPDESAPFSIEGGAPAFELYMQNVTAVGAATAAVYRRNYITATTAKAFIYNCTFICRSGTDNVFFIGGDSSNEFRLKNLLIQGAGNNYLVTDSADEEIAILTQDASSPNTTYRNKTVQFIDATNWDYRLSPLDTAAYCSGSNLSSEVSMSFIRDGEMNQRAVWDVGASNIRNFITVASDNFNRANESPLASPWATVGTADTIALVSNEVRASGGGGNGIMRYTGLSLPADQWAEALWSTTGTFTYMGLCLRATNGGDAYFTLTGDATLPYGKLSNIDNSTSNVYPPAWQPGWAEGDKLRIAVRGSYPTIIDVYRINTTTGEPELMGSVTDTNNYGPQVTGDPGIVTQFTTYADDWSAGYIGPLPSTSIWPVPMRIGVNSAIPTVIKPGGINNFRYRLT